MSLLCNDPQWSVSEGSSVCEMTMMGPVVVRACADSMSIRDAVKQQMRAERYALAGKSDEKWLS